MGRAGAAAAATSAAAACRPTTAAATAAGRSVRLRGCRHAEQPHRDQQGHRKAGPRGNVSFHGALTPEFHSSNWAATQRHVDRPSIGLF
ncbi:MAG: hypothetical protein DMF91_01940 [Acidobacteria bacterium]|nr:MAG: hypothetical protein DMF91_01940 [Acidobacteriota bacterium]